MSTTTITVIERETVARINEEHRACVRSGEKWVAHALEAGRLLAGVKGQLRHGEWLPWVEEHFDGDDSTASLYMRVAANPERVPNFAGARDAKQQLAKPKRATASDVGSFLQGLGSSVTPDEVQELERDVAQAEHREAERLGWSDQQYRKRDKASSVLHEAQAHIGAADPGMAPFATSEMFKQAAIKARHAAALLDELAFSFER